MAHIQKYKAPQVNGILEHNSRTDATRQHNHSNEDIDPTKTHLNYELHSTEGTALERYKARMSELHCMQRDDVTVFDSLVVTLPKNVKEGDERAFFESCYGFACKDFGKENIVNATVHNDETTPHIHIGFIPTVKAKNRKGDDVVKVRHSALITKKYLCAMHEKLSEHISQDIGYEVSILNGATAGGAKKIEELKAQRAKERAEKAEKEAKEAEVNAKELQGQVRELTERVNDLTEQKEKAEERAKSAESSLVNLVTGVPPFVPEPYPDYPEEELRPETIYYGTKEQIKSNEKAQKTWDRQHKVFEKKILPQYKKEFNEVAARNEQARKEWESKYLTSTNLDKARQIVEDRQKQSRQKETELDSRENALRRKETALNERERNLDKEVEEKVTRQIEGIFEGRVMDREFRLRDYCDTIKFKDGTSALDRFEEQEQALRESIEVKRAKGQGFSR